MFDKRFSRFWASMNSDRLGSPLKLISVSGGLRDEFIEEGWTVSRMAR